MIYLSDFEGSGPISVPAAIIFGLLTSFIQSFGLTIQRKSHIQNARLPNDLQKSEWRRPMWVIGFFVFLIANIGGTVFQIGALPIVMLAPLGAVSLLYNALLARFILDDFFSKHMIVGTALIAVGAVLIGYFGVVQEPNHSLDDLLSLFIRPTFVAFATLFTLAFLGILAVAHLAEWQLHMRLFRPKDTEANKRRKFNSPKNKKKKQPMTRRWSAPSLAPVAEVSESSSGIATPVLAIADEAARRGIPVERVLIQRNSSTSAAMTTGKIPLKINNNTINKYGSMRARGSPISSSASSFSSFEEENENRSTSAAALAAAEHDPAIRKICLGLAIAYGGASGTLSGACLLLAKSGVELLVLTIAGDNQFNRWQSWFLVIIMLFAALLQLWYLNKSLRLASPPLVCPLAFCFYNTSSIALGMVYFDQLGALSPVSIVLVILGVFILLSGVWMVSLHGSENEEGKGEPISDEEIRPLLLDNQESLVSSPESSSLSPTNTIPKSTTTETEAILANFLGVAGPHLPPVSPENGSSTDALLQSGERDDHQNDEFMGKRQRRMRSRSGSTSGVGTGHMAGLGFHIPGLPTLQREIEESIMNGEQQIEDVAEPSSSRSSETGINENNNTNHSGKSAKTPLPNLRTNVGGGGLNEGKQSSTLLNPPSAKRRGLYESLIERGLSIGISPSSPGFHVGSSFELEPEEEDSDGLEARRLWKNRLLSRRTFSENDTSLASARRKSKMATTTTTTEEDPSTAEEEITNVHEEDDRQSINSNSAWTRIVPTLDIQTLNDRLRKLKVGAGDWIGKKKT